jgi:hypothetical protein
MSTLPNSLPESHGPIFGTPNHGRAERIDRAERDYLRRCFEASAQARREQRRHERGYAPAEVRELRAQNRRLLDQLAELRHQLATLREELAQRISRQLADELPGALHTMSARGEHSGNGKAPDRR